MKFFGILLIMFSALTTMAEEANPQLKKYADSLRYCKDEGLRYKYNDSFKLLLKELLIDDNCMDLNLDSISKTVSVLTSEDKKMRTITWVYTNDLQEYVNHGVVLYRKKPSDVTHVYWLKDFMVPKSDSLYEDFNADLWPGALYYQMYQFKKKRKDYYCVLGFDGMTSFMNRKVLDVLWVDKDGELHIGAPVFYKSETDYTPKYRIFFDHADQTSMVLRFEPVKKMITFSNLVPSNPSATGKRDYYIPDGRIDYYLLNKKGKWILHEGLTEFDLLDH